ncbi:MAG: 7-cyano-7-deazaguanine synthase QueC [Gammaproteobacteria bacterium RIFCSPHIGHO2_12_FULL_38_14]|nr:MAG: 7-cyano-7-deazaguanine synthase QueC [Gammaproteobacteria bacterium RIFCSPHIGHO2_12_FULL_38_14]
MKKAVILLSGGLDSTTCLAYAKHHKFDCYALSFNYNQRHNVELDAAKKIAAHFGAKHKIFNLEVNQFGGSALTDTNINVPDYDEKNTHIPVTYVPARNTIFLSIALAWAEVLNAKDIFIGVSHVDYSGYPDCRPEYIKAFQDLANLATKFGVEEGGIKIHTPIIHLSKAETIKLGHGLGVDYGMTVSCYKANEQGYACGKCDSCALRKKGFAEAMIADATRYNVT